MTAKALRRSMRMGGKILVLGGLALGLATVWLGLAPIIGLANHDGSGAVHVCANNTTGEMRLVNSPNQCRSFETGHELQEAGLTSDVFVVNDDANPVPVKGDPNNPLPVSGTVQAQQDGTWDVNVSGGSLDTSMSTATKVHNVRATINPLHDTTRTFSPISASFIQITSQDDDVELKFYSGGVNGTQWLNIGRGHDPIPNVITIPLTERFPIDTIYIDCANLIQFCDVNVDVIGQ